ncbi:esterase-like activity of phytase family protein [Catenovulum sp. 2E275]|uniref:esterase-like activity of phytase family protein n=1 Tax=Catenovulum sp. 2E275 TaxID=2980497 RepID=UPI0021D13623|nr:esterase-like activity of phytase family protein [Catenovulum sp. 2E275]MCU4676957.1 esterase-like activity of phytase family protein [Catenovulum sp. 2E275]
MKKFNFSLLAVTTALLLSACNDGKDGANGTNGTNGVDGAAGNNGLNSLLVQTQLSTGNEHCWLGGVQIDSGLDQDANATLEASEITSTSYACNPDTFGTSGVRLPYSVMRNDLNNVYYTGSTFEVRNGGYGSDMDGHPTNPMQFYALTDRGPNANYRTTQEGAPYGNGKKFPTPDYTPRIGLFEIQANGSIAKIKDILLKDRDGNAISGLPNSSALGGTGEVPYNTNGEVIRQDMTQPYDATTNPAVFDDYGLDSEGLAALSDGTFWVSDEYGPHMVHYSAEGVELERINPFAADDRNLYDLPAEFGNRWANRGMEGLTITPDEKTLVGIMQSSLDNPSKNRTDLTRIVTVNLETGAIAQYLYRQDKGSNSNSAIKALSATQFLVLERDGAFYNKGGDTAQKYVYKIDISNATNLEGIAAAGDIAQDDALGLTIAGETLEQVVNNAADYDTGWNTLSNNGIVPAEKLSLVVDMVNEVSYPHDKMEGLWVIDEHRLGVLNDDDFATWSEATSGGPLGQKYLDSNNTVVDGNTLYIVAGLDLSAN